MKLFTLALLILFTSSYFSLSAQSFHHGYVVSLETGEPIVFARITTASGIKESNLEGYFSVPAVSEHSPDTIVFEALGYEIDTLILKPTAKLLQVEMKPYVLQTITVSGSKAVRNKHLISPSLSQLKATPVILGQPDILKSLTVYPGIAGGQEGLTGIHVRGGNADQNLIRLDGSTIYNPGHLFGFLSVFNPDIIRNVDVHKNYIPGRFGGRLSSVIDVQSKNGSATKTVHTKEIGLISLGYTISGPLKDSTWTYLAGGRLAHSGILTLGTLPGYLGAKSPLLMSGMYDLNLKLSKSYDNGSRLIFGGYMGDDLFGALARSADNSNYSSYLSYGNRTLSFRFFTPLGKKWFSESLINFNRYASGYRVSEEIGGREPADIARYKNIGFISETTLRQSVSTDISQKINLSFGLEAQRRVSEPVRLEIEQNGATFTPSQFQVSSTTYAAFVDAAIDVSRRLSLDLGLRYAFYRVGTEDYSSAALEPRLALNYEVTNDLQISTQYIRTTQQIHSINNRSGGLPITFWIPANERFKPQTGNSLGFSLAYFGKENTELRLAAYTRTMRELIELPTGEFSGVNNSDWLESLEGLGRGESYGLETYYRYVTQTSDEWSASYTFSRTNRRFATINQGETYPYDFDRPHDLFFQYSKRLSDKWNLVTAFTYQTGRPVNVAQAVGPPVFGTGDVNFFAARKNNGRFPDNHRLDVVFVKRITTKRNRTGELKLGLYNVYGKVNPVDLNYSLFGQTNRDEGLVSYQPIYRSEALFRFFPIISHTVTW